MKVIIGPRDFIHSPYIKCPKCGKDAFGILGIAEDRYFRRCKECLYPDGKEHPVAIKLPKLNKKVIYLDQFVLSNIMFYLNPQTKAYQKGKLDKRYMDIFQKISSLSSRHLILCPDSMVHLTESILSPYFEPLKQVYKSLSHGVSFLDLDTIKRFQITEQFRQWLVNGPKEVDLNIDKVTRGKINIWTERYFINVNTNFDKGFIKELRAIRKSTHKEFESIFKSWQTEKKVFKDWFEEERNSYGKSVSEQYIRNPSNAALIDQENTVSSIDLLFSSINILVLSLCEELKKKGYTESRDRHKKVEEYLLSDWPKELPFNKISALLFAGLARNAATGKKNPPSEGIANDINVISVLLPYCDAMFLDKECCSLLRSAPINKMIEPYNTKVFSLSHLEEFFSYLDDIERNAPEDVIKTADELYGI